MHSIPRCFFTTFLFTFFQQVIHCTVHKYIKVCPPSAGSSHSCRISGSACRSGSRCSDQGESGCYPGWCFVRQQHHHCFHRCVVSRSDKGTNCCRVMSIAYKQNKALRTVAFNSLMRCLTSLSSIYSLCVFSGLVMVAVIIGSKKVGINPDNMATPITASLGDLITLSLLAGVSTLFFFYRGQRSHTRKAPLY